MRCNVNPNAVTAKHFAPFRLLPNSKFVMQHLEFLGKHFICSLSVDAEYGLKLDSASD
jgi:hypothetical protein